MYLLFNCPNCKKEYVKKNKHAGKNGKCICGNTFQIPEHNEIIDGECLDFKELPDKMFILGDWVSGTERSITGYIDNNGNLYYCFWTQEILAKDFLSLNEIDGNISEIAKEEIVEFFADMSPKKKFFFVWNPNLYHNSVGSPDFSINDLPTEKMFSFKSYRDYWPFVKSLVSSLTKGDEILESQLKKIWSAYPDKSFKEISDHINALMEKHRIGELKIIEFDFAWQFTVKTFAEEGIVLDNETEKVIKDCIQLHEDLTIRESLKYFNSYYELAIATKLLGNKVCSKCGESHWDFLELSPNRVSAKFQCSFCDKTVLVKESEESNLSENSSDRYISKQVQREVWRRDRGQCVDCGSKENIEFDHIIPFSKGGSNTARNVQLLCQECNREKSDNEPGTN